MRYRLFPLTILLALVSVFAAPASAQTINGTVVGVVTDEQGAAVPGVAVTATNVDTNATRTGVTNDEGLYRIAGLPVGTYTVKVEKTGFSVASANVGVTVGTDSKADFTLKAGGVTEQVTVVATGTLLDTTQSQVSKSVDQVRIMELPGRNSLNGLALLNPGVLPNQNGRPGSGFAVNGNRTRSNNFTIDGANNNDQSLSIPRLSLPPEALGEFQIITNTPSAEFGRNAGSYVNQITKSGTNEFHGVAWWAWDGNGVDALTTSQERTFKQQRASGRSEYEALRAARSVRVDNIYGFTLGGPVVRNHTFFFTDLDFVDDRRLVGATRPALGATAVARLQALAADPNAGFAPGTLNFLLNTFPRANDATSRGTVTLTLPAGVCSTATSNCVIPFEQFNRSLLGPVRDTRDQDRWLGKANTQLNDKDQLSFRYLIVRFRAPIGGTVGTLPGQDIGQNNLDQSFTVNDVYAFSSRWINEARFTYSRRSIQFPEDVGPGLTITGAAAFTLGNDNFPQNRLDNVYEWTDNVAHTTGNHNMKFGVNVLRYGLNSFFAPNSRGRVTYSSLANFLRDQSASFSQYAGTGSVNGLTYETSVFAQDDWRFRPDLTFNLGLRYEYVTTPFGFFSEAKPDVNNFGPRAGFAWNPTRFADGRFVLRGGFGISYDQVFQNVLLNNSRNFPRGVNVSTTGLSNRALYLVANRPTPPTPEDYVAQGNNPAFLALRLFSPGERVKQPMSYQWTTSVQYQFGRDYVVKAEYIGTKGKNLIREVEVNIGFCGVNNPLSSNRVACNAANVNTARLDPTRGSILVGQGQADSIYHAGQFTIERRFQDVRLAGTNLGGLQFNANFTYSAFISTADDVLGGQANRTLPSDPRDPDLDRARSGFDQPRRFVASYVWNSPEVLRDNAFLSRVFSGWEIAGITTLADGTPFSVLSGTNSLGIIPGQVSTVELSQRVGLLNPNGARNSSTVATVALVNGVPTVTSLGANPNARYIVYPDFSGVQGSLGANTERTGGTINTDLTVAKSIRTFGETQRLQLRAEIFNLFNHRNFTSIPENTLTTSASSTFLDFGQTNITGRNFLFGLRYIF